MYSYRPLAGFIHVYPRTQCTIPPRLSTKTPDTNIPVVTPGNDPVFAQCETSDCAAVTHERRRTSALFSRPDLAMNRSTLCRQHNII